MRMAGAFVASLLAVASLSPAIAANVAPPTPPDCGSVVIIKCDPPAATDPRREAARQMETRRTNPTQVMDRIIIEDDAIRGSSPESIINRTFSRPLVAPGVHSYSIGESAQCTCMNICPPPPFPCCNCTDRVGSSLANAPGWKPTR